MAHTGMHISRSTVMVGAEKAEGNKNFLGYIKRNAHKQNDYGIQNSRMGEVEIFPL